MEEIILLILLGLGIGTVGTLIGAGGGFILVPLLLLLYPSLSPEKITAISMAVVAANASSGSFAYIRSGRVDFKAGVIFAICTIPGSVLGVYTTRIIPRDVFNIIFGVILISLAILLFVRGKEKKIATRQPKYKKAWVEQTIHDKMGHVYQYAYDLRIGIGISILVGYFSPLLGIGGGIIHVPALVQWLYFPVHIATATSHFILAIMSIVSVIVHMTNGVYKDPFILKMTISIIVGVIPGAQLGAFLSAKLKGKIIVKALAVSLAIVGIRILLLG